MEKNHKLFYTVFPSSTWDTRKTWVMSRYDFVYSYRLEKGRKLTEGTFRITKTHSKVPYLVYFSPARLQDVVRHSTKSTSISLLGFMEKLLQRQKETYYLSSWRGLSILWVVKFAWTSVFSYYSIPQQTPILIFIQDLDPSVASWP